MSSRVQPVYFFPGPEAGRKREHIGTLRAAMRDADGEEPEVHRFYPYDTDVASVIALLRNGSLFSSRRMVTMADAHALKSGDQKAFVEYLSSPSTDAVLIFTSDETPGSRDYPKILASAVPKSCVVVFWEMFDRDKRGWVMKFFRDRGMNIEPAALDVLLDVIGGTTDSLKEACEMLTFSRDKGAVVTETDVDRVLEHSREETVYSVFDRFCRRDLGGVIDAYRTLIHSDPSNVDRILSMLAEPLNRLRDFTALVNRGLPPEVAAGEMGLRGGKKALRAYTDGAHRYTGKELAVAITDLVDLEAWLRTSPREVRSPRTELWFCRVVGRPD